MKKFINFSLFFVLIGFFIISCSNEENIPTNTEKATISFGAVLNDLLADKATNKQAVGDLPACTDDEPSYVEIILMQGDNEIVGSSGNPFQIDLVTGQIFTEEVPELELDPGIYTLDHFAVYNTDGDLIWLAPRGGTLGNFIEDPLPLTIDLSAGVKKYVDVPVLCYDDRDVNEYGYLFFDLIPTEAVEFCFFANYCDETGRHFPASFSLNVWLGTDDSGTVLYSNVENSVSSQGADPSAQPLCVALPDLAEYEDNEKYIYYEINLLDWDGVYGDVDNAAISGTLSRDDIQANFDGDDAVDYEHIRFGCEGVNTNQFDSDVATGWYGLLADLSRYTFYFNPQSARIFAYSGLTLYESVVPGMASYKSIFPELSGETIDFEGTAADYYWPASANAALAEIARKLVQDYPQPPNLPAINQLESEYYEEFQEIISQEQLDRSVEFGKLVANEVYDWSRSDGTFNPCPPYTPIGGPGNWEPTPPMFFPAAGACQGDLRTFIPGIVERTMPAAPPTYSADPASEFYQMHLEVMEITQNLTPEELVIIQALRDIPGVNHNRPSHLLQLTANLIDKENLNLADASVLLAKQGFAIFDAIVANFAAKFEYALVRPVTYIHDVIDPSWQSVYPAPQHPSYPAVSTGVMAAVVEVLEDHFGTNYAFEDATQEELYGIFYHDAFENMVEHAAISRTHSGLNYQFSVDVGEEMGKAVGDAVNSLNFRE